MRRAFGEDPHPSNAETWTNIGLMFDAMGEFADAFFDAKEERRDNEKEILWIDVMLEYQAE